LAVHPPRLKKRRHGFVLDFSRNTDNGVPTILQQSQETGVRQNGRYTPEREYQLLQPPAPAKATTPSPALITYLKNESDNVRLQLACLFQTNGIEVSPSGSLLDSPDRMYSQRGDVTPTHYSDTTIVATGRDLLTPDNQILGNDKENGISIADEELDGVMNVLEVNGKFQVHLEATDHDGKHSQNWLYSNWYDISCSNGYTDSY